MAIIMDGKRLLQKYKNDIAEHVEMMYIKPRLSVVLVGNNPASEIYVKNKQKDCQECGINIDIIRLKEDVGQQKLLDVIDQLNCDYNVDGILCQLPLPEGYDYNEQEVCELIRYKKDVDVFNPYNVGKVSLGNAKLYPCTPHGVISLLDAYDIDLAGKHCVIISRSNIVGKPMAMLLLERNATVTVCHSKTKDLKHFTEHADVIISAAGKPNLITADMIKEGAIVVDVAINRDENGKLCGDVDFENVKNKAGWITPVPGGCGLMTRAMLLKNILITAS